MESTEQANINLTDSSSRERIFTWGFFLVLGWILYEATHQPGLAAIALCLKFGWDDFRTSFWLKQCDPDRMRGTITATLFWSCGLARIALIATAMLVLIVFLETVLQPNNRQNNREMYSAALFTLLGSYVFCGLGLFVTCYQAHRFRVRLWYSPMVHGHRRCKQWPPIPTDTNQMNQLFVYMLVAIAGIIPIQVIVLCLLFLPQVGINPAPWVKQNLIGLSTLFAVGTGLLFLWRSSKWFDPLVATTPSDCWGQPSQTEPVDL